MMFIKQFLALILMLLQLIVAAQTNDTLPEKTGVNIVVKIHNISSEKGVVYFSIFNSEENFNQRMSFQNTVGIIKGTETEVIFENIPEGTYAIICYHDENENNQLDFDNFIPSESWGASGNPSLFEPPSFNATKFEVKNENLMININF